MTIRIVVADDHPVVRSGLVGLLSVETDLEVVAEASDGEQAFRAAVELQPDLVLMDLRMPGHDGVWATSRITKLGVRVLVLTTYETDADIVRAVEAGATGYLLKDTSRPELIAAVRAAAAGRTTLSPSVAARLVSQMRTAAERLTPREVEVLGEVAQGLTNADIGRKLHITEATVKTHLLRIFTKLDVDDRTRAVTTAINRGFLPPNT